MVIHGIYSFLSFGFKFELVHRLTLKNGAGRDRTDDPQTASLMLSQLSYSPFILFIISSRYLDPKQSPTADSTLYLIVLGFPPLLMEFFIKSSQSMTMPRLVSMSRMTSSGNPIEDVTWKTPWTTGFPSIVLPEILSPGLWRFAWFLLKKALV